MDAKDFEPYLNLMATAYEKAKHKDHRDTWFRSGTDDALVLEFKSKLVVAYLGTQARIIEWLWNLAFTSDRWDNWGRVHRGFARNVKAINGTERDPDSLLNVYIKAINQGKSIEILGHSRGGPLAALTATQLVDHSINPDRIKVVCCGSPKMGGKRFAKAYAEFLGRRTFVLNGSHDPVTKVPWWGNRFGLHTHIKLGSWFKPRHRVKYYLKAVHAL